jgi:hypothetical protein
MAIATLENCYSNLNVFTGVVKIRKGTSCSLLLKTNTLDQVHDTFYQFSQMILKRANAQRAKGVMDPSYARTVKACDTIAVLTGEGHKREQRARRMPVLVAAGLVGAVAYSWWNKALDMRGLGSALVLAAAGIYTIGPSTMKRTTSNLIPANKLIKQ